MNTVSDLIDSLGGPAAVGRIIGKEPSTVSEMKRNGSIKVSYWPAIIAAAEERNIEGVSPETLMRMHSPAEVSP